MRAFAKKRRPSKAKPERLLQAGYLAYLRRNAPRGWSYDAKHIMAKAELVDRMVSGELDRVRIHEPPRHAKTSTITINLPVFLLEHDPTVRILITCHTASLARKFGRQVRNLARQRGVRIAKDSAAASDWTTEEGGYVVCRGVGAPPTGQGFDWIIIDDPIKSREQADSATFRDKLDDWYTEEIYTRLEPGGKIIGIWTLWHEDDLAGRLDARSTDAEDDEEGASDADHWTVLKLSALAGEDDPLGRAPGEALWPERISRTALLRIRSNMKRKSGLRGWEALYQQNPSPLEGDIFKVALLKFIKYAPPGLKWVRAWDAAVSESKGDYTAGVMIAEDPENDRFVIRNVRRAQYDTGKRDRYIVDTAIEDGEEVEVILPEDPGAAGKSQTTYWAKKLAGFKFRFFRPRSNKVVRAEPLSSQVNAGNVALVEGPWNSEFIEELRQFPTGVNDDQVDAAGDGYKAIVGDMKISGKVY